jgi:hypothetical protein
MDLSDILEIEAFGPGPRKQYNFHIFTVFVVGVCQYFYISRIIM